MANYPYEKPGTQLNEFRETFIQLEKEVEQDFRNLQSQISKIVTEGDSGPQAAAAAIDAFNNKFGSLKERLDENQKNLTLQVKNAEAKAINPLDHLGDNTIPAQKLKQSSDADKIKLANLSQEVRDTMAGQTTIGTTPAPGSVTETELAAGSTTYEKIGEDVKIKNYPFASTAAIFKDIKGAVLDVEIYNALPEAKYTIGQIFKNYGDNRQSSITIFDYSEGTFNKPIADFTRPNYNPASTTEWITLNEYNGSGITARILINWEHVTESLDRTSLPYEQAGLSTLTYRNVGLQKIEGELEGLKVRKTNNIDLGDIIYAENEDILVNDNARNHGTDSSAIRIKFKQQDKLFNAFKYTLHDKELKDAYFICMVKDWYITTHETHIKPFEKNKEITIILDKDYNLKDGIEILIGYVDKNMNMLPGSFNWVPDNSDSNIETVYYGDNSSNIFTGVDKISSWGGAVYHLGYMDNVLLVPKEEPKEEIKVISDVVLPNNLYLLNDSEYFYYDDCILRNYETIEKLPHKFKLSATNDSGQDISSQHDWYYGFGKIKGAAGKITFNLECPLNPDQETARTINIKTKPKATGKNPKVLMIGDSFIAARWGDGIQSYIRQFAALDGNSITYLGSMNSYDDSTELNEARGGWTEEMFYKNTDSSFVFNGEFNFKRYLETNNISVPEVIVFHLGMNGGNGYYLNLMVNHIKAAYPSIKILICTVPSAEKNGKNRDSHLQQSWRLDQNKYYISLFDHKESEGIYLIPVHMNFHRVYGMMTTDFPILPFDEDNYQATERVFSDLHPTGTGAKGEAYMIYNYLLYAIS